MWGAISSATRNIIKKQKIKFKGGETAKIAKNGNVLNKAGEVIGKAFYKGDRIYVTDKRGTVVKNVFTSSGKEVTDAVKKLPKNSILQLDDALKYYTDDNGNTYRVGDSLLEKIKYSIKGYEYSTDELSRIKTFATDNLQLKDPRKRLTIADTLETISKGFQKAGDHRGHLFGDQFNGSNSLANIVAMSGELNTGAYKDMEQIWADALRAGKRVKVSGELIYSGSSRRPEKIIVKYIIDNGDEVVRTFIN